MTGLCCWPDCTRTKREDMPLCGWHLNEVYWISFDERAAERGRKRVDMKQSGTVYYLLVGDRIKVGWSSDFDTRLKAYPPYTKVLAVEVGSRADESAMHQRCTPWRVAGREWYEDCEPMRRVVEEAKHRKVMYDEALRIARVRANPRPVPPPARKTPSRTR